MPHSISKHPGSIFLLSSTIVVFVAATITIAVRSIGSVSVRLAESETTLAETQHDLLQSDQFSISSIDELDRVQEEFVYKVSRQMLPSNDYTSVRRDLMRQLSRWMDNSRVTTKLPLQRALANYRLGQLHSLEGNNLAAIPVLERAVSLASENGDKQLAARAKNTLACTLSQIGMSDQALRLCGENVGFWRDLDRENVSRSIALRNFGLLLESKGENGIAAMRDAVNSLSTETTTARLSIAKEIDIDTKVTLSQLLLSHHEFVEAERVCRSVHAELESMLPVAANDNVGSDIAPSIVRYRNAIALLSNNLAAINANDETAWRWNSLVDLATEIVNVQPPLGARAVAEFDSQSGVVLAWGTYSWAHAPVLDIARATHDRWRIEVIADSDEMLEDAIESFRDAEIPTDNIRFGLHGYEVPWFRDTGPIVCATPAGNSVWIDPSQVRHDVFQRPVNDALPRLLSTRWKAKVVKTPLCIAGGAITSNGQGLTLCSKSVIEDNIEYGFSVPEIKRQLHYVTGASDVIPVPPLIGELTGHIDLLLTFTDSNTLVLGEMRDTSDPNRPLLDILAEQFRSIEHGGRPLRVVRVPMPPIDNGYANSYTNVIFANGVLLVPSYRSADTAIEKEVRTIYEGLLPDWEVRFIDCTWLASKGGSLHCLSSNLGPTPHAPLTPRSGTPKTTSGTGRGT